jgi:hypothetical protein
MKCAFAFVALLGLVVSSPPAMAQERIPTPLASSIAREAARLGTEAARAAQDASASTTTAWVKYVRDRQLEERLSGGRSVLARDDESVTVLGPEDQRVTLIRPLGRVTGRIDRWDGRTLTVSRADGTLVTVPRGAIARLERRNGQADPVGRGLLIGAGIGIVAGAGYASSACRCPGCYCDGAQPAIVGVSTVLGLGIGALVGAFTGKSEWVAVDLSALDK